MSKYEIDLKLRNQDGNVKRYPKRREVEIVILYRSSVALDKKTRL